MPGVSPPVAGATVTVVLDLRLLRADPETVKAAVARRGEPTAPLDEVIAHDRRRRRLVAEADELRAEVKKISASVGALFREDRADEAEELRAGSRELTERIDGLSDEAEQLAEWIRRILLYVPNMVADDCPDGAGPDDNVALRTVGYDPDSYGEHQRVEHTDIGEQLGILDFQRAVRMSGAMFAMYRGLGARLVRALIDYGLDRNRDLYEEIRPPTLVRTETMTSTGHLPKFSDDAYLLERDNLWAIPTAEVPLTSLLAGETVDEDALPIRLMSHTSCFRREAGSAGSDTRGLLRLHEFDKVELYGFCTPEQAQDMHREILHRAESAIADLGLAYRVLDLCTADLGAASARTFDIEAYAPGADRWLEVSSVSWCRDYQARRAEVRYRPADDGRTRMVHSLNGSGLAVPRVWVALVETCRRPDGSVAIPEALLPYMGGIVSIPAR
ncbi:MAG: serine--tRNA ligase [Acidimicrobiaceae bacterium]|nr:serine--tRNA ligase [Acidimicrobiaceae bacterium]